MISFIKLLSIQVQLPHVSLFAVDFNLNIYINIYIYVYIRIEQYEQLVGKSWLVLVSRYMM